MCTSERKNCPSPALIFTSQRFVQYLYEFPILVNTSDFQNAHPGERLPEIFEISGYRVSTQFRVPVECTVYIYIYIILYIYM